MKKVISFLVLITLCLPIQQVSSKSNKLEVDRSYQVIFLDNKQVKIPDEYKMISYNDHVYLPLRYMSELLEIPISYEKEKGIYIESSDFILGPKVNSDQAKLVAFEEYQVKKIKKWEIRILTKDELQLRPEDKKDLTPVYYVLNCELQDGDSINIYVSSNKAEHNFKIKQ
ncbi:hypothetical protein ACFQZR_12575 [Paenibacillus sp. GCM10027629]|uniref:hypothetical protein n=1 Tax=Paenibacillus sp. GCM10027629 TaxID=3273414 RepID=UPI003636593C